MVTRCCQLAQQSQLRPVTEGWMCHSRVLLQHPPCPSAFWSACSVASSSLGGKPAAVAHPASAAPMPMLLPPPQTNPTRQLHKQEGEPPSCLNPDKRQNLCSALRLRGRCVTAGPCWCTSHPLLGEPVLSHHTLQAGHQLLEGGPARQQCGHQVRSLHGIMPTWP